MIENPPGGARYDTWIRKRNVILFWTLTVLCAATAALGFVNPWLTLVGLTALPFAYIAVVISLAAYRFAPRGGDYQNRIHQLLVESVDESGSVLDIGCGSGHLIIKIARARPHTTCTGVDLWGDEWEYSRHQCQENVRLEGVEDVRFVRASASDLPFETDSFDSIVSCLTFHEVLDQPDKTTALGEALRVLKPGGTFALLDLFADNSKFSSADEPGRTALDRVIGAIVASGGDIAVRKRLSEIMPLPYPMDTGKVLRHAVLLIGTKR